MTDITTYPLEDGFETELSQARDGAVGTIYVNATPSFTFPAGVTTYIIVDPGKSTMQLAKISAYDSALKTITVSSISVNKGASVAYTQQSHQIGALVRISHNYQFWKDMIDGINSKMNTNSDDLEVGKFADATARDAYFTSPVNGNSAYLTAEGKWTDYVAGAWADRDQGTVTVNASTTVAGKVEIATQAEFDAGTATGGTGAILVATTDQSRKQINTATAKSTPVNADLIGIADSAASGVIKKTTLTELKAASDMQATTTTSGFVEMATDAEALAGSDQVRYVNPYQQYTYGPMYKVTTSANLKRSADTEQTVGEVAYTKKKEIQINQKGTISVSFDFDGTGTPGTSKARIYVNGVAVGTERTKSSPFTGYTTYTETITVEIQDLVQLYLTASGSGIGGKCRNFRISYDKSNLADGVVVLN